MYYKNSDASTRKRHEVGVEGVQRQMLPRELIQSGDQKLPRVWPVSSHHCSLALSTA